MKRYITWQEYLKLNPRGDRYLCDELSKNIILKLVETIYGCVCTYFSTPDIDCSLDFKMFCPKNHRRFICEIKDRWNFVSTAYNDQIIETKKLNGLKSRMNKGEGQQISLFSIYSDGAIKVTANILKNLIRYETHNAPATTALDDHDYVDKLLVLIKPDQIIYFCMLEETNYEGNLVYRPIFQYEPINVNELNKKLTESVELF